MNDVVPHFDVAIGVIKRKEEYLIAKRPPGSYMPGLWEFPGGKCENNESPELALKRELEEELGIFPGEPTHLITIHHEYPGRNVVLFVYLIEHFEGEPHGKEGQEIRWISRESMEEYQFPPANQQILAVLS